MSSSDSTKNSAAEFQRKLKHYRISQSEYEKICHLLGRDPRGVEWALFSALWSEHCSYKSSKVHLKKFAKTINRRVVTGEGENAGVVDLGQGERIVFKMESHNHPSFIEPFQGAATGVGGILRDIFTMGARPIALADYLCFGEITAPRMKSLINGVVKGISSYGNSVGVPTVTGQTNFDSTYNNNILVNAMAVGLLQEGEPLALSQAKGVGNWVVYVGAKTGKDGVHGAAMASESFDEKSEAKKPNVQIGDPFFEKLLIESCLEVLKQNLVVAIQDMGAAGLTSSSFEMAAKGGIGLKMHLDQVPLRDQSMTPEEIMLSESQERMLLICEPAHFEKLQSVYQRWGLDAVKIGEVVQDPKISLFWKGDILTSIDPGLLVQNAPQYERGFYKWDFPNRVALSTSEFKNALGSLYSERPSDWGSSQNQLLKEKIIGFIKSEKSAPRNRIFRQYDQRVGGLTARDASYDVAIQRLPKSHRGLATVVGCRTEWMKKDAQIGALDAVFYPSFQMMIKGATPIALTDCLNFGNPENPKIMSEFVASVDAIRDACIGLDMPVVSGNVSFYNETMGKNITSTPATGLIGLRQNVEKIPQDTFTRAGNQVVMIGLSDAFSFWTRNEKDAENKWFGDLQINRLVKLGKIFLQLSAQARATQMVGRGGIAVSLIGMSAHENMSESQSSKSHLDPHTSLQVDLGFKLHPEFNKSFDRPGAELCKETLYQALFEVEDAASFMNQAQALAKSENLSLQVVQVADVVKGVCDFGGFQISVSEVKELRNESQGRAFESLA